MGGPSSGSLDDAGLLEWVDRRRLESEIRRQVCVGITICVPVLFAIGGILWMQTLLFIAAASVFVAGLLAWMVFGFIAWRRAVEFCDAVEGVCARQLQASKVPLLEEGDRIGSMVVAETEEGLVLVEQTAVGWLQTQRLGVMGVGVIAALGAVAVGVSMLGSGSVGGVRGWTGVLLMGAFAFGVVMWLCASCRTRAVWVGFKEGGNQVRVIALGLLRRHERVVTVGVGSLVDTTQRDMLRACTLDLRSGDGLVELARVALPRDVRDRHSRRTRGCVLALCEIRAARLTRTIAERTAI